MKFVIADVSGFMTEVLYNDIIGLDDYIIINKSEIYSNKFLNKICKLNISLKANKYLRMPLKMFFYKKIFGGFEDSESLCFYFGIFWYDLELFDYIRSHYPKAKLVFNFHDTIASKEKIFKSFDINDIKRRFDLIYTYSILDSKKYALDYTPDMYSKFNLSSLKTYPTYDVVFIGAAKDRLATILEIYDKLEANNISCWFYIVGAPKMLKEEREGVIYSDKYLPFKEVIARQIQAKCLLEVTQSGCTDATLRFWDAVMYNKKILTNCEAVLNYSYYDPKKVLLFKSIKEINADFVTSEIDVDYHYSGDISPVTIFRQIQNKLEYES